MNILSYQGHLAPGSLLFGYDMNLLEGFVMTYAYCYVRRKNTVMKEGVLSPSKAPLENIQHYAERAGGKDRETIVAWLDGSFPGRSRSISILSEPIPYNANPKLVDFANRNMLCRIDVTALERDGYVESYCKPKGRGEGYPKVDGIDTQEKIPWTTTDVPEKLLFQNIPHYFMTLKDGVVPHKYVRIIGYNQSDEICPVCGEHDKYWVNSVDVFHCPNDHQWFNWLGSDSSLPTEPATITFPKNELESVEWDLGKRTFVYTTRILEERGKYKQGHLYKSPYGCRLLVEEVKTYHKVEQHPFIKELTTEQIAEIGSHPFDVLKLRAVDTCNYNITGIPFWIQKDWLGSGDKASVVHSHFNKAATEGMVHPTGTTTPTVMRLTTSKEHLHYVAALEKLLTDIYTEMIQMRKRVSGITVDISYEKNWLHDEIVDGASVYASVVNDEVVGGSICDESKRLVDTLYLQLIGFAPKHRGKGYGKMLIKTMLAMEKEAKPNLKYADLLVLATNPAKSLYERLGFKPVATEMVATISSAVSAESLILDDGDDAVVMQYTTGTEALITKEHLLQRAAVAVYENGLYCYVPRNTPVYKTGILVPKVDPLEQGKHYRDRAMSNNDSIVAFTEPIGDTKNPALMMLRDTYDLFFIDIMGMAIASAVTIQACVDGKVADSSLHGVMHAHLQKIDWHRATAIDPYCFQNIPHFRLVPYEGRIDPKYIHRVPTATDDRTYYVSDGLVSGFGPYWNTTAQILRNEYNLRLQEIPGDDTDAIVVTQWISKAGPSTIPYDKIESMMKLYTHDPNTKGGHVPPFLLITSNPKRAPHTMETYVLFGNDPYAYPLRTEDQRSRAARMAIVKGIPPDQCKFDTTLSKDMLALKDLSPNTSIEGCDTMTLTASTEALSPGKQKARLAIIAHIVKHMNLMDPDGDNGRRYTELLTKMSDAEFSAFMTRLKEKKEHLHLVAPAFRKNLSVPNLMKASESLGVQIFQRLWLHDPVTGRRFLTKHKYPILVEPVRRAQQFLDKKISIPENDKKIDAMTGQVTGDDRAAGISAPEEHILRTRGLSKTLRELVGVRGGDIAAFGEFKRQIEENGSVQLDTLSTDSRARSGAIVNIFFKAMHLDNNF
jgi:ribosomal protein S18 acetylase RimI-like enzyme